MSSPVLLITGASSGIGRATALHAASRGYAIGVHFRTHEAEAEALVAQLHAAGARAAAIPADLTIEADVIRLYDAVSAVLGPIAAVVNSAGVALAKGKVQDLDALAVDAMFAINVLGLMLSCREAVRRMAISRGGGGGVIVNLSSMAATIGGRPGSVAYAASKAAVDAFSIGLAKEVAAEAVRVVSVRPGMVETEMTRASLAEPSFRATVQRSIPLGRPAHVDEVARPIVWLLSSQASFISGACIDVSGGGFHVGSTEE